MHLPTRPRPSPTRHPYVHFFPVDAPFSSGEVLVCRSLNTFCNHLGEKGITRLIVPSWNCRFRPAVYYTHCYTNPTTHWQMPYKFSAPGKKKSALWKFQERPEPHRFHRRMPSSPLTSKPNTHAPFSSRSGSLQLWANCQFRSELWRWIDIEVCQRHLFNRLLLWQHSTNNVLQDLRLDI